MVLRSTLLTSLLLSLFTGTASAEFQPNEVAVVVNRNSEASRSIAKHYAERRGIPPANILEVQTADQETVSRSTYNKDIVAAVRSALLEKNLSAKIKVLVTTSGLPLRILASEPSPATKEQQLMMSSAITQSRDSLVSIIETATAFAADKPEAIKQSELRALSHEELLKRANVALHGAGQRMEQSNTSARNTSLNIKFSNLISQFGGLAALSKLLRPMPEADQEKSNEKINRMKQQLQSAQRILSLLDELPDTINQKRALQLTMKLYGVAGVLQRADALKKRLDSNNTDASLESELSLLWWDDDMYPLQERVANPWFHRVLQNGAPDSPIPVLLVSRLDAPTAALVAKAIDAGLAAEKDGLTGKIYFDARGLREGQQRYIDYDDSIQKAAKLFREHTSYEVVLDTEEKTFSKPNEAENTAVYVGWYRLRHYEDAFTFTPGAIGFHVASEEALSIRNPDETGWCRNALAHGVSVTMGAVAEPFLDSFPAAHEFLGLLLTGNYSLVEAYYLSLPYLSWRMTIFGDPLYNPWRGKNFVTGQQIADLRPESRDLTNLPPAPSKQVWRDPGPARTALAERRTKVRSELEQFYAQVEEQTKAMQKSMPNKK